MALLFVQRFRKRWITYARKTWPWRVSRIMAALATTIVGTRLTQTPDTVPEFLAWDLGLLAMLAIPVVISLRWVRRTAPDEWRRSIAGERYTTEFHRRFTRYLFKTLVPWVVGIAIIAIVFHSPY